MLRHLRRGDTEADRDVHQLTGEMRCFHEAQGRGGVRGPQRLLRVEDRGLVQGEASAPARPPAGGRGGGASRQERAPPRASVHDRDPV